MPNIHVEPTFNPVVLLRSLAELDYDMVEAYETAIDRLDDRALKDGMRKFADDHRRHIVELNLLIVDLGGKPLVAEDVRRVLVEGKVFLASVAGDRRVVKAMLTNEKQANRLYVRMTAIPGLAPILEHLLDANLGDELEHRAWMHNAFHAFDG